MESKLVRGRFIFFDKNWECGICLRKFGFEYPIIPVEYHCKHRVHGGCKHKIENQMEDSDEDGACKLCSMNDEELAQMRAIVKEDELIEEKIEQRMQKYEGKGYSTEQLSQIKRLEKENYKKNAQVQSEQEKNYRQRLESLDLKKKLIDVQQSKTCQENLHKELSHNYKQQLEQAKEELNQANLKIKFLSQNPASQINQKDIENQVMGSDIKYTNKKIAQEFQTPQNQFQNYFNNESANNYANFNQQTQSICSQNPQQQGQQGQQGNQNQWEVNSFSNPGMNNQLNSNQNDRNNSNNFNNNNYNNNNNNNTNNNNNNNNEIRSNTAEIKKNVNNFNIKTYYLLNKNKNIKK